MYISKSRKERLEQKVLEIRAEKVGLFINEAL
jgi:hypothetical protein